MHLSSMLQKNSVIRVSYVHFVLKVCKVPCCCGISKHVMAMAIEGAFTDLKFMMYVIELMSLLLIMGKLILSIHLIS